MVWDAFVTKHRETGRRPRGLYRYVGGSEKLECKNIIHIWASFSTCIGVWLPNPESQAYNKSECNEPDSDCYHWSSQKQLEDKRKNANDTSVVEPPKVRRGTL